MAEKEWVTFHEATKANAQILATANETFFADVGSTDQSNKEKHGSFNYLEIVNTSGVLLAIDLDGLTSRRRKLFANSTLIIEARENTFWNSVKVTNLDAAAAAAANDLVIIGKIMRRV